MAIVTFDSCQVKSNPTFGVPIVPRRRKASKPTQRATAPAQTTAPAREPMERQVFNELTGIWRWERATKAVPAPHVAPARPIPREAVRTPEDEPTQADRQDWAANAPSNREGYAVEGETRRYTRRTVAIQATARKPVHKPFDAARECAELIDAIRPGGVPHDSREWSEFYTRSEQIEREFGFRR